MREADLSRVLESVKRHPGPRPLFLEFVRSDGSTFELAAGEEFTVGDERELIEELSAFTL
jgi:hypothetical protein